LGIKEIIGRAPFFGIIPLQPSNSGSPEIAMVGFFTGNPEDPQLIKVINNREMV
jgi:hypothetical protein